MSDPRLALSAGNVEYRLEPKWLEACAFHKAQPYGLTDFTEVAGALGENQPKRHPFFAGPPITSATVNLLLGMEHAGNQGMIGYTAVFRHFTPISHISRPSGGRPP
jgi:hypothetical protein